MYTIKIKQRRPRINADTKLPMYQKSVDSRIAAVRRELGWDAWQSIQFEVSRLNNQ